MNRIAWCLVVAAAIASGVSCSSNDPSAPGTIQNAVVFTRDVDQSTITFESTALLYVWCGDWEQGAILIPTLHIVFGGPAPEDPHWSVRAVVDDVTMGVPLMFPNSFTFDQPKDVDMFVNDSLDIPPNELSTQAASSSGAITFQQLNCIPGGVVQFSIDAVIGSEFGNGPSVTVTGSFQATVGQSPN